MSIWRKLFGQRRRSDNPDRVRQAAEFLAPLTHEEKVTVSNALPELYERVMSDKRRGLSNMSTVILSGRKLDIPALLWKLNIPDLERLAEALKAGMQAEAEADKNSDEAIRLFRLAFHLNPFSDMAAMGCGVCLFRKGNVREAVEWIERAIKLNPNNTQARRNLDAIRSQI